MCKPITIGNFDYTQDEKGNWIFKAKEAKPLNKNKPQYREKPQFKLQEEIEGNSENNYRKILGNMTIEITRFIKDSFK